MPIQFATFQLATLQLATFQLDTMTARHSDNSPPLQLDILTTRHLTTQHYDNSTPRQLITITTRHHENLVTYLMETYCKFSITLLSVPNPVKKQYSAIFHGLLISFLLNSIEPNLI
jgi:hypothetical protein